MKTFTSIVEWQSNRPGLVNDKTVGFVPTMGALHKGHLSLVRKSVEENDLTVVSIFLNPTQFDNAGDLENYPRSLGNDSQMLSDAGADILLTPSYSEIYADDYRFKLHENEFSSQLCGKHRPGHFDGVLTVVLKLLNIAGANRAYFGEKDYQQYLLIRDMARAFFVNTDIVSCPTIREADGLAASSRNLRLKPEERKKAPLFYQALVSAESANEAISRLEAGGFNVDYVEDIDGSRYGAVHLGKVRLIDNINLNSGKGQSNG